MQLGENSGKIMFMAIESISWSAPIVSFVAEGIRNPSREQAMNCAMITYIYPDDTEENLLAVCRDGFDRYGYPVSGHTVTHETVYLREGEVVDSMGNVLSDNAQDLQSTFGL